MFTQTELDDAISKIIRTSIRREYGELGNRRSDLTFSDTVDAAAGVFITKPNAAFYVVKLAADGLIEAIAAAQTTIADFTAALTAINRRVTPIKNVSSLANAKVALDALTDAIGARSTSFSNLEVVPAFQRFDKNTQRFLEENGKNIRSNQQIVDTPSAARKSLGALLSSLKDAHAAIIDRTTVLSKAIEEYSSLNLPGLLSQTIISNARDVLQARFDELNGLTENQRLDVIRGVTLDILAARAAVRGFGSLASPTTFIPFTGTGQVFADADHPATAASLTSLYGPFSILPFITGGSGTEVLGVNVDGTASLAVPLLGSYLARFEGVVKEPYDIGDPNTQGISNHSFTFELRNYPNVGNTLPLDVDLIFGAARTAREVADDINDSIGVVPVIAEPYANPLRFAGNVDIDQLGGSDIRLLATNPFTNFVALGVQVGDHLIVRDHASVNFGRVFIVTTVASAKLDANAQAGFSATAELNMAIELGAGSLAVRIRLTNILDAPRPDVRYQALANRMSLFFPSMNDLQRDTLYTLGWAPVMETASSPSPAKLLSQAFQLSADTAPAGVPRVNAVPQFEASLYTGMGRTEVSSAARVVIYKLRADGGVGAGTSVTFTLESTEGAEIGDIIVVRAHPIAAQVGVKGVITAVTDTSISATMDSPLTASSVSVEVGPNLSLPFDATLFITGGSVNDNEYTVRRQGTIPFELDILPPLAITNLPGSQPITFNVLLGQYHVVFSTFDTTLASAIIIDNLDVGSAFAQFFSDVSGVASAVGQTRFFKMSALPTGIEVGDTLELYATSFDVPSFASDVTAFDTDGLLELADELPVTTPVYTFSSATPVPFARIRKRKYDTYTALKSDLEELLAVTPAQASYFEELSRLLNGVTTNANPTIVQTNDVKQHLQILSSFFDDLDAALQAYDAEVVSEVDTLIRTFQEKGADRGVALLLQARFGTFFSLDPDGMSYAGELQRSIRDVEKNDLPIRRTARTGRVKVQESILASYDDIDFEYDHSDIDTVAEPDIPGAQGVPFPNQSY